MSGAVISGLLLGALVIGYIIGVNVAIRYMEHGIVVIETDNEEDEKKKKAAIERAKKIIENQSGWEHVQVGPDGKELIKWFNNN